MYKVIKHFIDLHDDDHSYEEGDIFPREGVTVKPERIAELAGSSNKQKTPLIVLVEDPKDESGEKEAAGKTKTVDKKESAAK